MNAYEKRGRRPGRTRTHHTTHTQARSKHEKSLGGGAGLELQVALHQLAKLLPVFVLHVHEFHAAAVRTEITHNRGEVNLAKSRTNLQLDRVSHAEFLRRFQIRPAQADGLHARKACLRTINLRTQR